VELTLSFVSAALLRVRYADAEHENAVTIAAPAPTVRVLLELDYDKDDSIEVRYGYRLSEGQCGEVVRTFVFHKRASFNVAIVHQKVGLQQFEIRNVFSVGFTVLFEGKKRTIGKYGRLSLLRPGSDAPLDLVFREDGWEDFPIRLSWQFRFVSQVSELVVDVKEWLVGDSRAARLSAEPNACPVETEGWVVAPIGGNSFLMIPLRPGRLPMPQFLIKGQVVECTIRAVDILPRTSDQFNNI
jgi:hypothetical protein